MDGEIDSEELSERLNDNTEPKIVDIRSRAAFRRGHIPGSINVPFGDLTQRIDEVADAEHVVTVCPHGKASVKAARLLSSYQDFDGRVESLRGGLDAWEGPVEADETSKPADEDGPAPF